MSDDNKKGRCPKTGRFLKGYSGNYGGRGENIAQTMLPHEFAALILETASFPIDVKDRDGKSKRLPAQVVVMRQLAAAAAKGDKVAMRLFTTNLSEAAKITAAHAQRQFDRLGAFLRSVDEGKPWRLDAAEAAFYQNLADQAGFKVIIKAYDATERPEPLSAEDIDAVVKTPNVWRALGDTFVREDAKRETVRRVIYAHQKGRRFRGR